MLKTVHFIILLQFQYICIKCSFPNLNVRRLDSKLIERKRQDTLEMCRMFNEENEKIKYFSSSKTGPEHIRPKRSIPVNPALNAEEKKRVDAMIDQLYEDINDKNETKQTVSKGPLKGNNKNETSRRFNFAPAVLLGPLPIADDRKKEIVPDYFGPSARFPLGIVPFYIDPKTYDSQLVERILDAFDYFEKATCVRLQKLRERPTDSESLKNVIWLYITNPSGIRQCVHSNERHLQNGVQMIVFGYDCMSLGDITHEVMHILGFSHEHTRTDRDQYVSILWDNIKPGYRKYFEIYDKNILESLPYDYASVLHYPSRAFSKNGQITIMTPPGAKIGQREGLSETDVEKVGAIYSSECLKRNKDYLLKTCPSVVKADTRPVTVTQDEVEKYFQDRVWPYGIVNVKIDLMEFSVEEKENIHAVMRHIEKETCIEFQDLAADCEQDNNEENKSHVPEETDTDENENNDANDKAEGKDTDHEIQRYDTNEQYEENDTKDENKGNDPHNQDEESDTTDENVETETTTNPLDTGPTTENTPTETTTQHKNKTPGYDSEIPNFEVSFSSSAELVELIVKSNKRMLDNEIPHGTNTSTLQSGTSYKSKNLDKTKANVVKALNGTELLRKPDLRKNKAKLSKAGKLTSRLRTKINPRAKPLSKSRRHAQNILILKRSAEPGCKCPAPGRPNGDKELHINGNCFNSVNDLLHLFVHVLGLDHQHNMHDRDSFLHIVWGNLTDDVKKEMKEKHLPAASVGFAYDYQSVMHYPWLEIKNGTTNIMYPIWNDGWAMGRWQGLSSTDVKKLNIIYAKQCQERNRDDNQKKH